VPLVLSSGRRAVLVRNRTCSVCGATSARPWPLGPDRRTRFCPDHLGDAWRVCWESDHRAAMLRCHKWACEVLSSDGAVSVAFHAEVGQRGRLVVVDFAGHVLTDTSVALSKVDGQLVLVDGDSLARVLSGRLLVSPVWWEIGRFLSFIPRSDRFDLRGRVYQADWWVGQWFGLPAATGFTGSRFDDDVKPYQFTGDLLDQAKDVVYWVNRMRDSISDDYLTLGDCNA